MAIDFYSKSGESVAYTEDEQHIYLFSGRPVAFLSGDAVYSFSGKHIGWFEDGWIRDREGKAVFFMSDAYGGPIKPVKRVKPVKGVKRVKSVKPIKALSWSDLSGEQFFV